MIRYSMSSSKWAGSQVGYLYTQTNRENIQGQQGEILESRKNSEKKCLGLDRMLKVSG